jgi:hypothetical protein
MASDAGRFGGPSGSPQRRQPLVRNWSNLDADEHCAWCGDDGAVNLRRPSIPSAPCRWCERGELVFRSRRWRRLYPTFDYGMEEVIPVNRPGAQP